ncbi:MULTISPECIES: DUF4405 domain-containing protein [unclassified Paenibacillus]|uniref:DUF4405 domain-containing protein n=1 Tax=unclassified Paenibacillus TaxID=185978 RepID=UPI00020D7C98|nr:MULTISPECIES: DUF4405 domain-containing protein [unclassified Paenibacillus]EGL14902.1 hypothetical protein HMPREF9413_1936 [Paenibacillus sp. HGF7]EPD82183.1 hypothetical protein HMPREF1207_04009 [Paenibacillus sp. HGH0039]
MKKITLVKLMLDLAMALTLVLLFNKRVFGGLTFHEIAGLAISFALLTHILLNLQWVKKVTLRIMDRSLPGKTRFGYLLNVLLLVTMTFIIISGILISEVVFRGIRLGEERWFKMAHISISYLVLVLIGVHVGMHWQWVIQVTGRIFSGKAPGKAGAAAAKIAAAAIVAFGAYEMYATNFLARVEGVGSVFGITTASSPMQEGGGRQRPQNAAAGESGQPPGGFDGERQSSSTGDTSGAGEPSGEGQGAGGQDRGAPQGGGGLGAERAAGPGGFHPGEGRGGVGFASPNPLGVIAVYSAMMGVFVAVTYYTEKRGRRRKHAGSGTAQSRPKVV